MPYEDGSRDWNDAAVSPETPTMASNHQMLEIGREVFFSTAFSESMALWVP